MGSKLNKRYVYNPETGEMDEVSFKPREYGQLVVGDLEDFVSPVDGTVVHGRAGLREHDRRNGTTNIADYKETWAKNMEKRAAFSQGQLPDSKRTESVRNAFESLRNGHKPRIIRERDL